MRLLDSDSASDRRDDAPELGQHTIAGRIRDATAVNCD